MSSGGCPKCGEVFYSSEKHVCSAQTISPAVALMVLDQLETLLGAVRDETWKVGHPVPSDHCTKCAWTDDDEHASANIYEVEGQTDITHPHAHMSDADAYLACALRNNARMLIQLARNGMGKR